jgi:hypothetical protein
MYHEIGIERLSPTQISKLLNGHRVRVKHGAGHKIHASQEQHKKIMSAHHKGKAHTLQFDPYQIAQHQHLRGHFKSHGEGEGMMGGSTYAQRLARRTRNTFKPVGQAFQRLAHEASPYVRQAGQKIKQGFQALEPYARQAGEQITHELMNAGRQGLQHAGQMGSQMISDFASQALAHPEMALGQGVRRRGRPRKHIRGASLTGGALYPAGYGMKTHHKKHHKKGKKHGKGDGVIGSTLGHIAGSFLPF